MTRHPINLAELQGYIVENDKEITVDNYRLRLKVEEEGNDSFTVHLRIKERDSQQEKLVKFRIGIEQHEAGERAGAHDGEEPHFLMDYYRREEGRGAQVYFTLDVEDEEHLLDCVKGTLVVLKEFLRGFEKRNGLSGVAEQLVYVEAIEGELSLSKNVLIDTLHESFASHQLVVRVDGKEHTITTRRQLETYLNVPEAEPIYLPLLDKIQQ
ncbi:MAG: hypothetical protein ACTSU7_09895 [Candidatus Heimdallarchaeaceae archaeon]